MSKRHPNQESRKSQKNRERSSSFNTLPQCLLDRGICTQFELVMALLPYMEWVSYQSLRTVFWKYITTQKDDGPLRKILYTFEKEGIVEKRHEGVPPELNEGMKKIGYLYIRRIARKRDTSLSHNQREKKLKGMYGFEAEKKRAEKAKRGKAPPKKTTILTLTQNDIDCIRANPENYSDYLMAKIYNVTRSQIGKIRRGHTPDHLKARPSL